MYNKLFILYPFFFPTKKGGKEKKTVLTSFLMIHLIITEGNTDKLPSVDDLLIKHFVIVKLS